MDDRIQLFAKSLQYLEDIHNTLVDGRYDFDDLSQFQDDYVRANLGRNVDLGSVAIQLDELLSTKDPTIIGLLKSEIEALIESYSIHQQHLFLIDNSFPYYFISDTIRHTLALIDFNERLMVAYPKLSRVLRMNNPSGNGMIGPYHFNPNFFTFDHNFIAQQNVSLDLIQTTNKRKALQLLEFLCAIDTYKVGDKVGIMSSTWTTTRTGKQRWCRADFTVLIPGNENGHYLDTINDAEYIYMQTSGVGLSGSSITKLYRYTGKEWIAVKTLQQLIR